MKTKFIIIMAVGALALVACQSEGTLTDVLNRNDILNFSMGFAGSGELVLSKGTTLTSEDGTVSIPLSCTVTDGIEVNLPDALTKGTQINSEAEFLGAELTSFTAAGWSADKTEFIPSSTAVSYSDGLWQTAGTYRWRGSDSKTFLAYANLSSNATVTNSVNPSVKQTFTYTVPTDARQQNDIMLGWYKGDGSGTATAAITMVHPLTAVVFKAGEIDESITAIKDISIEGVYTSGKADVTYELSGSDIVPTYDWKAGTVADTRTGSQTVTLAPLSPAEKLEIDEDDNTIGVPFIVLPQTVAAGTLTLTITVVKDGEDAVLAASVPAGNWEAGKTNTFTIGYIGQYVDLGLSVKWGNFNLGASKREEYGEYYSWAGLENVASTSINLDFSHCPYHTGSDQNTGWMKYNSLSGHGTVDNKTILDLDDDVAHVKKQGPWHMPTEAQWDELLNNCTQEWVDDFNGTGVAGMKLTSKIAGYTDRYIFLPAAGYRTGNTLNGVGTICDYWYPQMKADNTYGAYYIYITKDKIQNYDNNRYTGRTVRPVYDDTPKTITAIPASGCESMGTVSGSGSYLFGKTATLSATPADGYVFSKWNDGVTTATRTITVTADATYEATFETSPVLPGEFSVSATKKVHFSKGNLYCTRTGSVGSYTYEFAMENHQYDFRTRPASMVASLVSGPCVIDGVQGETPDNMSGFFLWDIYDKAGYGAFETSLTSGTTAGSDVLDYGQVFGSDSKWTTLTKSEFEYLTNGGLFSSARPNADDLIKKATIHLSGTVDVIGYVIAPDDFTGTLAAEYTLSEWETAEEASSLVFLPWIGSASGNSLSSNGIFYWSQSASETNDYYAYCLKQNSDVPAISGTSRAYAFPVRLVQRFDKPEVEPDFIDLGLPSGTLWADVNAGAVSKTGAGSYGKFYAWGETESKAAFTIDNYKFTSSFTKYNGTNGLAILDLVDDAAYAFDGKSVIPTREQYEELINSTYTTCTWKDDYQSTGIPGLEIKSKSNGNSIFLPAAGLQNEAGPALVGTNGCYWSSTLNPTPKEGAGTSFPACAIDLDFEKNTAPFVYIDNDNSQRFMGQSIRAVKLNAVKPTPALSYNINGGTGATMPSGGTFTAGDFVTVQAPTGTPVRDGYTFIRYNTNANGGGDVYYPGDKFRILDDVTLYAEYGATLKKGDEFNSAIGSPTKLVFDYYSVRSSTVGPWSEGTDVGAGSDASHIKKFTVGTTVYILSDCIISLNEDCHDMLLGKSDITEIDFGNGVIDTHKVTNFQYTFSACSGLTTLDLSDFDTKSVNNFAHMFNSCSNLETIKVSDKWECGKRIPDTNGEHSNVFGGCNKLVGGNGTTFNDSHKGASYAQVDGNGGNPGYFTLK